MWCRHYALNVEQNPKSYVRLENLSSPGGCHDTPRWPQNLWGGGGSWWDWRTHFPWTTSSNILVHLGTTQTNTGESLIREFNASDSYQSVGRPLEPHQNLHSWALRRYKKSTKATIKAPSARNYEAISIHSLETNKVHRFTQKFLIFKTFLLFSNNFHILTLTLETLW